MRQANGHKKISLRYRLNQSNIKQSESYPPKAPMPTTLESPTPTATPSAEQDALPADSSGNKISWPAK